MADKAISELVAASQVKANDLFVLEQDNAAKKLTGQILENWLVSFADGHGGIQSIAYRNTDGLEDTYVITLADTTTFEFTVTNGKSITGIAKSGSSGLTDTYKISYNDGTSTTFPVTNGRGIKTWTESVSGLTHTYTITYNDNTTGTIKVKDGEKGDKGDNAYLWIKYASQKPTASSHSIGDVPDDWIGVYSGNSSTAPTGYTAYDWFQIKGEKGDTGDPATLNSSKVEYQVSDSGTIIPSGVWSTSVPVVAQGKYLWTRTTQTYNTGNPVVSYSVGRMGLDGSGSVSSVAGISPDSSGNVPLTAGDVGALAATGGDVAGEIRMNGQPISGLNPPTEDTQAANKGYVDEQISQAAAEVNLLDNSDFQHFVAQAGVAEKHGTKAYAGDRWILDSGTVTGTENANGNGYSGITLNGTIRQIVAEPPAGQYACAVEMVSGTATIAYADGEVTITSSGGVLKNAGLYAGSRAPKYVPKGYSAELLECKRYYLKGAFPATIGPTYGGDGVFTIAVDKMRVSPTRTLVEIISEGWGSVYASDYVAGWGAAFGSKYYANFRNDSDADDVGKTVVVCAEFFADL